MSDRFEREPERASEERPSASMMHLLGQMLMLPFTVFVYGMEMFVRTIKGIQHATDQGMDLMAGGNASSHLLIDKDCRTHQIEERVIHSSLQQVGWGDFEVATTTSTSNASVEDTGANQKETVQMTDRNLSDDQLKLVRFKILFVKRDYEAAFREQEALVPDNMTGEAFTAWKVAEFIQELGTGRTQVPSEWSRDEQGRPKYPKEPGHLQQRNNVWYLVSFPEKDKKYLRVYYEVLDRYVREEEDDEVVVLKEIRDAIHERNARNAQAAPPPLPVPPEPLAPPAVGRGRGGGGRRT
jgi:hypothetical protein